MEDIEKKSVFSEKKNLQYLDYYLLQELIDRCKPGYVSRVQGKLSSIHNFTVSKGVIYSRIAKIRSTGKIRPAAEFNGIPGIREGKDQAYAGFWALADIFLSKKTSRRYIGLPANQITIIAEKVHGPILAIEKNIDLYQQQNKLVEIFDLKNRVLLINNDIFKVLTDFQNILNFNIFDLDLMQALPGLEGLKIWVKLIRSCCTAETPILLNLAATIGRNITKEEHNNRVKILIETFKNNGLRIIGHSQFAYKDRQIPISTERFILKKRIKKG
jgi:hypothetical protein